MGLTSPRYEVRQRIALLFGKFETPPDALQPRWTVFDTFTQEYAEFHETKTAAAEAAHAMNLRYGATV